MVKVTLLKPLNGQPIGSEAEYSEADCKTLEKKGAVQRIKEAPAPKNKAEPAPKNKAAAAPKRKAAASKSKG